MPAKAPNDLSRITVRAAMHPGVFTCRAEASGLTAARVMAAHHVHAVVVVDDERQCMGLLTEADIAAAVYAGTIAETAQSIGSSPLVVAPEASVLEAAQVMHENESSHVIVVDDERNIPIGMLSVLDLIDVLAEDE